MATNFSSPDSQSTSPARPALPVVRPSAHMRTIAYILRQAARFNEDAENKTVYQSASEDLEAAADRVDETEQKLARLAADNARLRAALAKSDPWNQDFRCIHCGEEYFLLANEHKHVHKPDCIYLAAVTAVQS